MKKNKIPRRLRAFSLIEISIALIIIGLITAAVFKGQDLIETARVQATIEELNQVKLSILNYRDQFGQWPGNDSRARDHFGLGVTSGSGDGTINQTESTQVWRHLKAAGLAESDHAPPCRIGGIITIVGKPAGGAYAGNWLVISNSPDGSTAALTPKQAMLLKAKAGEPHPQEGYFIVMGLGNSASNCHNGQTFNLAHKSPACIVMLRL
ncbi:prepilin-type N-terminal cleavage/methylation domain-containing protein [Candidatus Odyssella thessalonicensis]|uniref:prepilin-type N-terminal cleavage/methylation domain-containing protein n=1 Tax=Candidatus Odyssella thessalonicensis TaxID=84647 RepID=UPI000225B704|nr:prepilin-type N-terminal cleavage/methylation domain-containing protein [Candidatus Odyssella thessalonicensis]